MSDLLQTGMELGAATMAVIFGFLLFVVGFLIALAIPAAILGFMVLVLRCVTGL